MIERERRFRLLTITAELLMGSLFSPRKHADGSVDVIEVDGLPEGVIIDAIGHDFEKNAFILRLYHPSFDVVPECHPMPTQEVAVSRNRVWVTEDRPRGREFI